MCVGPHGLLGRSCPPAPRRTCHGAAAQRPSGGWWPSGRRTALSSRRGAGPSASSRRPPLASRALRSGRALLTAVWWAAVAARPCCALLPLAGAVGHQRISSVVGDGGRAALWPRGARAPHRGQRGWAACAHWDEGPERPPRDSPSCSRAPGPLGEPAFGFVALKAVPRQPTVWALGLSHAWEAAPDLPLAPGEEVRRETTPVDGLSDFPIKTSCYIYCEITGLNRKRFTAAFAKPGGSVASCDFSRRCASPGISGSAWAGARRRGQVAAGCAWAGHPG